MELGRRSHALESHRGQRGQSAGYRQVEEGGKDQGRRRASRIELKTSQTSPGRLDIPSSSASTEGFGTPMLG